MQREFDLIVYGASGFTGRQTVSYLLKQTPPTLCRWAVAGRNLQKLHNLRKEFGEALKNIALIAADSSDQFAMDNLAARTRVILSTAGPFAPIGMCLVDACVRKRTHYVDITGEIPWVMEMARRYHTVAQQAGVKLVPCCGFDSVPADLTTFLLTRHIAIHCSRQGLKLRGYYSLRGGINGGTVATLAFWSSKTSQASAEHVNSDLQSGPHSQHRCEYQFKPRYDGTIRSWVGPFFMSPINKAVVLRTQSLMNGPSEAATGTHLCYGEYLRYGGILAGLKAWIATVLVGLVVYGIKSPLRNIVLRFLPKPGQGPSEQTMSDGWLRYEVAAIDAHNQLCSGYFADRGDPGNKATAKYVSEAALCLLNPSKNAHEAGGVLTPATAFGDELVNRLRSTGTTIEIGGTAPYAWHQGEENDSRDSSDACSGSGPAGISAAGSSQTG